MKLINNTDWSLLAKYFAGETDEKGNRAVSEWLEAKPVNRTLFNKIKTDWENINTMNTQFNVDKAWDKLHDRIITGENAKAKLEDDVPRTRFTLSYLTPLRIAASLFLVIGLAAAVYTAVKITNNRNYITVRTAENTLNTSITLPDGSKVTLNSGTRLTYPKKFEAGERKVSLWGEAFFEVAHNKNWPFIIRANNALVKVLGTSFNVNTNAENHQVKVYVATGKVQLYEADNNNNSVYLEPGYTGTLQKGSVNKQKASDQNAIAWKTKIIMFNNTKYPEAIEVLHDVYKVDFVLKDNNIISTWTIRDKFNNDPLDSVLHRITVAVNLKYERSGNTIYISKE